MELRPISDLAGWYARELSEAFPENERKPLADMVSEMERGCYEPLGLYEGQALLGYATLWSREAFPGYVLLDYLGVTAGRRKCAQTATLSPAAGWARPSSGCWGSGMRAGP